MFLETSSAAGFFGLSGLSEETESQYIGKFPYPGCMNENDFNKIYANQIIYQYEALAPSYENHPVRTKPGNYRWFFAVTNDCKVWVKLAEGCRGTYMCPVSTDSPYYIPNGPPQNEISALDYENINKGRKIKVLKSNDRQFLAAIHPRTGANTNVLYIFFADGTVYARYEDRQTNTHSFYKLPACGAVQQDTTGDQHGYKQTGGSVSRTGTDDCPCECEEIKRRKTMYLTYQPVGNSQPIKIRREVVTCEPLVKSTSTNFDCESQLARIHRQLKNRY